MKTAKRIMALALCLMLILGLASTTFAADGASHSHTITIVHSQEGYNYSAFQLFKGDLSDKGVLTNIQWGDAIDEDDTDAFLAELRDKIDLFAAVTDVKGLADKLAANDVMDDPDVIAFADIAAKYVDTQKGIPSEWESHTGHHIITGLPDGYYLVINTSIPNEPDTTYSRHILEVVRNITVTHKGSFPKVEKKIIEPELELDANDASIGENENYEITGTMPGNIQYYKTYKYIFHDTLSKGLTFLPDTVKVTVNGVDVTSAFDLDYIVGDSTLTGVYAGGTSITIGIDDLLSVAATSGAITSDTQVIVTYSATVNENAVVASTGNPNKVYLEYDNNPNTNGAGGTSPDVTGKTPEDEVKTYVTELTILKKDGAGNALTGAEFTLTGDTVKSMVVTRREFVEASGTDVATHWALKDGTFTDVAPVADDPSTTDVNESTEDYYVNPSAAPTHVLKVTKELQTVSETVNVKAFVGEDGYVTFTGLGAGTYTLTESVTPDGFNTITPITFTITFDRNTGKFDEVGSNLIMVETDNTLYAEIVNVAGNALPSTGGIGTTIFYILGGLIFVGAAVLLIARKRVTD